MQKRMACSKISLLLLQPSKAALQGSPTHISGSLEDRKVPLCGRSVGSHSMKVNAGEEAELAKLIPEMALRTHRLTNRFSKASFSDVA